MKIGGHHGPEKQQGRGDHEDKVRQAIANPLIQQLEMRRSISDGNHTEDDDDCLNQTHRRPE